MLIIPELFGTPSGGSFLGPGYYWEMTGTVGVTALLAAVIGLWVGRASERWFFAGTAVVALVLAMGRHTPVYAWLLSAVPVFQFFRVPARFLLWSSIGLAALAAYGLAWVATGRRPEGSSPWRTRLMGAGLVLVMVAGLYASLAGPSLARLVSALQDPFVRDPAAGTEAVVAATRGIRRAGMILTAGAAIILLVRGNRLAPQVGAGALGLLMLGEVYLFGVNFYPTAHPSVLARVNPPLAIEQGAYRVATIPRELLDERWRGYVNRLSLRELRQGLNFNTALLEGIPSVSADVLVGLRHTGEFTRWMWADVVETGGRSPLLDLVGVRYLYDPRPHPSFARVPTDGFPAWFNPKAVPRGWLVTRYEVVRDTQEMERRLRGGHDGASRGGSTFDPSRVVVLYDAPQTAAALTPREDAGRILRREYRFTRVAFDVALTGPAILVLSDAYYPGWHAVVDGRPVRIYRANHAFRAVVLPATARRVEFIFRPRSVEIGAAISLSTLFVLLAVSIGLRLGRNPRSRRWSADPGSS